MCVDPSTKPGDHLVEDGRTLGLVVELVTKAGVGPALDGRERGEDLRRGRRHEAVIETVQDEGGNREKGVVAPDPGLLRDTLRAKTRGARPGTGRVGRNGPGHPWIT